MVMFDNFEEIFQNWREFSDYSKALVTFATALGTLLLVYFALKLIYNTYVGFRLYVLSQICCRSNFSNYGKWVVISGATDGIGLAFAKELARRGKSIIAIGRNEEKLAKTKQLLIEQPNVGDVMTIQIDLSDSSIENYEKIREALDPETRDIGILINNAGVCCDTLARYNYFDLDTIRSQVNVNILATLYLTRMIMPSMLNRKNGLIINISSMIGSTDGIFACVYGQTKTFIDAFSRQLQLEYSNYPVDIVNIKPGPVHTKLFTEVASLSKQTLFTPTASTFAKSALNAASTRFGSIAGIWIHGISNSMAQFINSIGLTKYSLLVIAYFAVKSKQFTPILKRRQS